MKASTAAAATKPVACVVFAALLALVVGACGGDGPQSAGPVPTVPPSSMRVGFIGLPPKGAKPSTPRRGELVAFWWGHGAGDWGKSRFWAFADGRLISLREADIPEGANPGFTGFLEQRLTPEGVELLRSQVADKPVITRDVTSQLPERAWADRNMRAYVASRYAICDDGTAREHERLWSLLTVRAKDVLRGNRVGPPRSQEPIERCWDVTTREARALAAALADAKFEQDQRAKSVRLSYVPTHWDPADPDRGPASLAFEPILPHGKWTCSPCG
jgi:hypothetical protein